MGFITFCSWRTNFKKNQNPPICIDFFFTFNFYNLRTISIKEKGVQGKSPFWIPGNLGLADKATSNNIYYDTGVQILFATNFRHK